MEIPTDVIDIYEQAFYVDYQNRKTDYVEKFIDIRWFAGAFFQREWRSNVRPSAELSCRGAKSVPSKV